MTVEQIKNIANIIHAEIMFITDGEPLDGDEVETIINAIKVELNTLNGNK